MNTPTAANDEAFALAPVRVLSLNAGATRMDRKNEAGKPDEIWVGTGADGDGVDIPIILRVCEAMPAAAELVCASIGRAVGLPIPEPFLVRTGPRSFPRSRLAGKAPALRFASQNVGGETFQQLLAARSEYAERLLKDWEHLLPVTVFDEWMANPDRNLGNILFVAGALYLIDHAEAFGSPERKLYKLAEIVDSNFNNVLGDILVRVLDHTGKRAKLREAQDWIRDRPAALNIDQALSAAGVEHFLDAKAQAELIDFVRDRLQLTHSLLCHRFGMPQLKLSTPPRPPVSPATGLSSSSPPA